MLLNIIINTHTILLALLYADILIPRLILLLSKCLVARTNGYQVQKTIPNAQRTGDCIFHKTLEKTR